MIEKIGDNDTNKGSCSQVFSSLIPSTAIHRESNEI